MGLSVILACGLDGEDPQSGPPTRAKSTQVDKLASLGVPPLNSSSWWSSSLFPVLYQAVGELPPKYTAVRELLAEAATLGQGFSATAVVQGHASCETIRAGVLVRIAAAERTNVMDEPCADTFWESVRGCARCDWTGAELDWSCKRAEWILYMSRCVAGERPYAEAWRPGATIPPMPPLPMPPFP